MQTYFHELADHVQARTRTGELTLCWLSAEHSDFIRFNRSRVRQAINVHQIGFTLGLIAGQRRIETRLTLSGEPGADKATLDALLDALRRDLPQVPEDPYLLYASEPQSSEHRAPAQLPEPQQLIERVLAAGADKDLVGFHACGPIMRGFANSLGQRNWHETASFDLSWSLYHQGDKAVKSRYAGSRWDDATFARKMEAATAQLSLLTAPSRVLAPGTYRAWFTPTAMTEFLGALAWGGFGTKARRTRQSTLSRLYAGEAALNPLVSFAEDVENGLAPAFQADGFVKPGRVALVNQGQAVDTLTSPRSAREYGIDGNGANAEEMPDSLALAPGTLASSEVLAALDTGLLIGNLWYLNYSDRQACRLTGMTRFATFWVENGEIRAPLEVMRFDDSIYRLLGEQLLALGQEQELVPDGDTYGERSTRSVRTPGALVEDVRLTL